MIDYTKLVTQEAKASEQRDLYLSEMIEAIQVRLDDFAKTRNYDSILSACTYATSTAANFKAEGQRCVDLRDSTWTMAYTILGNVQAGTRTMPTVVQVMLELPVLSWL